MGKLEGNSSITHFSHQHPLRLQHLQSPIAGKTTCLACNGCVSGSVYACLSCNFYLHKTCSNLPRTLNHPSDQHHNLVLLSSPAYPEGVFKCNACGSHGNGFSYHCPDCQLDLHTTCADTPRSVDHASHTHTLSLCFRPPYQNQAFSCDICKQPGSNHWLYRCGLCEFDVHIKCATARAVAGTSRSRSVLPKSNTLPHHRTQPFSPPPRSLTPTPPPPPPNIQIYYSSPAQYPNQYQGAPLEKLSTTSQISLMKSTSLPHYETHYSPPPPRYHNTPPPPMSQPYYSQPAHQYQTMGYPQQVQSTPKQNDIVTNMAGHAVEGLVGSVVSAIIDGMVS